MTNKKIARRQPSEMASGPRHGKQRPSGRSGEQAMDRGTPWIFHSLTLKAASDQAAQERQSFHDALSKATLATPNGNQGPFPKVSLLGTVEIKTEKEKP